MKMMLLPGLPPPHVHSLIPIYTRLVLATSQCLMASQEVIATAK